MIFMRRMLTGMFVWSLIGLMSCSYAAVEVIKEISQIEEIVPYIDNHTLLVLDLDNTLIEPEQHIASDQWFDLRFKEYLTSEKNQEAALSQLLKTYNRSKDLTNEKLIETKSADIVKKFQKKGNIVLGLTSRGKDIYDSTLRHLTSVGINLSHQDLKKISYPFLQGESSHAYQGLIMCGGQNKGRSLVEYINYLKTHPPLKQKFSQINKIVYVDDKSKYLEQIKENLHVLGFDSFFGFRYARLDTKVASMASNMEIAHIQEEFLGKILTNEAANDILEARKRREVTKNATKSKAN